MNEQSAAAAQEIAGLDWELFRLVEDEGGTAYCQMQPRTFEIMRTSQLKTWGIQILNSYEQDLLTALSQGRNLLAEKYARMMESTSPAEYAALQDRLPVVSPEVLSLIEQIVAVNLVWELQAYFAYPALRGWDRPRTSNLDTCCETSVETYLRGELKTYSVKTLELLWAYTRQAKEEGRNLVLENMSYMTQSYGYETLAKAEAALKR